MRQSSKIKRLRHCQLSISSVTCTNHSSVMGADYSIQQRWANNVYLKIQHKQIKNVTKKMCVITATNN